MPATIDRASVTTLTAEVRVLMVGSRQVTLSVYRQLDMVNYQDIEPFGRVNDPPGECWVVGRDRTGALVRACFNELQRWNLLQDDLDRLQRLKSSGHAGPSMLKRLVALHDFLEKEAGNHREAARVFRSLPLIVLAGLK